MGESSASCSQVTDFCFAFPGNYENSEEMQCSSNQYNHDQNDIASTTSGSSKSSKRKKKRKDKPPSIGDKLYKINKNVQKRQENQYGSKENLALDYGDYPGSRYIKDDWFMHQCNKLISCLGCKQSPIRQDTYEEHRNSDQHQKKAAAMMKGKGPMFQRIKVYHELWNSSLRKWLDYQKFFTAFSKNKLLCLVCREKILIVKVTAHARQFPCSFVHKDNPIYDDSIDWEKARADFIATKNLGMTYPKEILEQFYSPRQLFDDQLKSDELKMFTMQKRKVDTGYVVYCLICKQVVCDLTDDDVEAKNNLEVHSSSYKHQENIYNKRRINQLFSYHRFFLTSRDQDIQQHQVDVNLHTPGEVKCAHCPRKFPIQQIITHLFNCANLNLNSAIENGGSDENDEENDELEEEDEGAGTDITTIKNVMKLQQENAEQHQKPEKGCYADDILLTIYPTCNTPRGQRRPEILTIQTRSDFEKYCLACNFSIYMRGIDHISSDKHMKMLNKKRPALNAYHNYWMLCKPEMQHLQIYFNPCDERKMFCIGCGKDAMFRHVAHHENCVENLRQMHLDSIVPKKYAKFECAYEKEIVRRYFYGPQYDLSRDVLGTDMPVAYVLQRHFFCLLCYNSRTGQMVRNVELWRTHLQRYHCVPGPARDMGLRRVLEFHEYWAGQTLERQNYLCHFTIKNNGVACDQGHFLQLEQSVEHVELDNKCTLRKKIEDQKKEREKIMQRAARVENENNQEDQENRKDEETNGQHKIITIYPEHSENATTSTNNINTINLPVHLKENLKFFQTFVDDCTKINCKACQKVMQNNAITLRHHISLAKHFQLAQLRYRVRYFCDICNKDHFKKEKHWLDHLDSGEHQFLFKSMPPMRTETMNEYFCTRCRLVIFGDKISLIRHEANGLRNVKKPRNVMTPRMQDLLKSRKDIEAKGQQLIEKCSKFRDESKGNVEKCIADLEALIKRSYPQCKIYQFGSRVAGFVVEDSDLDLFVDIGNKYLGQDLDYHGERKIVLEVRKLLNSDKQTYVDLHTVLSARVPIAKVLHAPTQLDCDLSFINGLSVENTRLIKFYADLQPKFSPAMLILKEWGSLMTCKLKNDMTSYALCMMLIFSLQLEGFLPSVHHLREITTFDVPNINGWDTVDYAKLDRDALVASLKQPKSVADVVIGFFKYYGYSFNYARDVVCPLLGRTFAVKLFDARGRDTPEEMHTYRKKVDVDPDAQFKVGSHMFVQDPFDLGHNLTKMANQPFVKNFKNLCKLSADHVKH